MEAESKTPSKKFFTRITHSKNKPKNTYYDIYYCIKIDHKDNDYIGSWVSLINKDSSSVNIDKSTTNSIKISGDDQDNHIRIRLKGLLETLKWVVGNTPVNMYKHIMVNLYCNDPFVINMLNTWIPIWCEKEYNISDTEERPNRDLLIEIGNISTKLHLTCQWMSEKTSEMSIISNLTDQSLNKLKND